MVVLLFVISIAAKLPSPNPKTVDDVSKRVMVGVVVGALLVVGSVVLWGIVTTGVVAAGVVATGVVAAGVVGRVEGTGSLTFVVGSEFCTDEVGTSEFVTVELSGAGRAVVSIAG